MARRQDTIDHAAQQAHEWVNELSERLGWPEKPAALRLMRVVLTELRDLLPHAEAAHLSAQLPLLIRGLYWENWRPSASPHPERGERDLMARIQERMLDVDPYAGAPDVEEVLRMLAAHISEGEISDVRHALPHGLRRIWPETAGPGA